jgi:hypothetical protein
MEQTNEQFYSETDEPIHLWFELSYSQYLTVPRSVMQAMPKEWQVRMAVCLAELDETIDWRPKEGRYWVRLKDDKGRYLSDPLREYRHPLPGQIKFFEVTK